MSFKKWMGAKVEETRQEIEEKTTAAIEDARENETLREHQGEPIKKPKDKS